jgi:hypothetical protein
MRWGQDGMADALPLNDATLHSRPESTGNPRLSDQPSFMPPARWLALLLRDSGAREHLRTESNRSPDGFAGRIRRLRHGLLKSPPGEQMISGIGRVQSKKPRIAPPGTFTKISCQLRIVDRAL